MPTDVQLSRMSSLERWLWVGAAWASFYRPVIMTAGRRAMLENVDETNKLLLEKYEDWQRLKRTYEPDPEIDG